MLKKWSCIPALLACMTLPAVQARNIFVTPTDAANTAISVYSTDPLSLVSTIQANAGPMQVLPGPGGKHFVVGRVASEGVAVLQGTFPNLQVTKRIALTLTPTAAAISPDGRRLIVVGPGGVQIIDTTSETVLSGSAALSVGTPVAVAVSTDSARAFVVSSDQQRVFAIGLEAATLAGQATIIGTPTSVSVSPTSLVYVTVQNAIYELHPQTLELRGTLSLNGFPGTVAFTPDGRFGVSPNTSNLINKSGFLLNLGTRTATDLPGGGFTLSKIVTADNASAYAYSSQTNRVYFINLASPAVPSILSVSNATFEGARDIVVSDEAPAARSLFILTSGSLYRIALNQNTAVGPISAPASGTLSFTGPPATGAPATLLQLNNTQTVAPGGTSLPIIVRAVDAQGVPLAGVAVTFAAPATVTLSATTTTTDMFGFAQSTVSVPVGAATGVATINASAGGQNVGFTININTGTGGPGGPAPTGTLTIVKGHGQVTTQGFATPEPLTVRVTDATGKPAPNVPVVFKIEQGDGSLGAETNKLTDVDGIASIAYSNFLVPLGVAYTQAIVSASTGAETVTFLITTVANLPNGNRGEAVYELRKPLDRTITARVGDTIPDAIRVIVGSLFGTPIPNIGIRIASDDPNGPTASCRGGIPLTDQTGLAVCDVVAGGRTGQTQVRLIAGENVAFPLTLIVTQGAASNVRITGGNAQAGNAGTILPIALGVDVTDAGGNLISGADVTWEVVSGLATLTETVRTTNNNGRASTRVTLGQQPGSVQIRARSGSGSATFSLTVNLNAAGLVINTGNNQSAVVGQVFAAPITVRATDNQNRPVPGASVAFQVVSGSATVSPSAATDANGVASVQVTAGQTAGPVTIQATLGTFTQTFTLTVRTPGPAFTASSIVNGAGYQPGVGPGGLAVITAPGIAAGIRGSVTPASPVGPLPTSLSGVEVLFNNVAAPIYAVSNINGTETVIVQVPFETAPGATSVTVRVAGGGSTTVEGIQILPLKPGLFDTVDASGQRYVVAQRPDGSYVSPANPALRGETIRVFAAGLGQTTPATGTNRAGLRDQNVAGTVIAGINNEGVLMRSARLVEGAIGIYIVDMEIPANTTTGAARNVAIAVTGPDNVPVFAGSQIPIQ